MTYESKKPESSSQIMSALAQVSINNRNLILEIKDHEVARLHLQRKLECAKELIGKLHQQYSHALPLSVVEELRTFLEGQTQ